MLPDGRATRKETTTREEGSACHGMKAAKEKEDASMLKLRYQSNVRFQITATTNRLDSTDDANVRRKYCSGKGVTEN